MSDYVTLLGSEQVANAGRAVAGAAERIERAVGNLDEILGRHLRHAEELVYRVEAAADRADKAARSADEGRRP